MVCNKVVQEKVKEAYPDYVKTICVDFDGTITHWSYPNTGKPQTGVSDALRKLKALGYKIVINSCRTNKELNGIIMAKRQIKIMKAYLIKHKIPFDEIDDGHNGKVIADYYIDDRAIEFDSSLGNDWEEIAERIEIEGIRNG